MGFAEAGVGAGQVLALLGLPILFQAIGLTPAFLAVPAAAVGLALAVAFGLPSIPPASQAAHGSLRNSSASPTSGFLAVGFAFVGMLAQVAVLAWMPTYLRQVRAFGVVGAGLSTGIVVTGLMLFSPIFGILSDRLTARRPVMLVGLPPRPRRLRHPPGDEPPVGRGRRGAHGQCQHGRHHPDAGHVRVRALPRRRRGHGDRPREHRRAIAASLGGPLYGALLDRGLGFGAVWGLATGLGALRVLAVLRIREPARADRRAPSEP